jgi:hypothetical protein
MTDIRFPGPASGPDPLPSAEVLAQALAGPLRETLARFPQLVLDPDALAEQLAPALSRRMVSGSFANALAAAISQAHDPRVQPAFTAPKPLAAERERDSIEAQVLAVITGHPAGRSPGLTPDALAALSSLPPELLGPAVSALVQAGELVRDAWLVRLPGRGDLLADTGAGEAAVALREPEEARLGSERRAIGDRRALGERRLYERRHKAL